jgi:8-oxo-dGTP diphosphatase
VPILLVRHGNAGSRSQWKDDRARPLDKRGRRQARKLVDALRPYAPTRILTSPYVRCVQTVEPLGEHLGLPIEEREELAEGADPTAVRALLEEVRDETAALCTHGDVIFDLIGRDRVAKKGSTWVLEPHGGEFEPVTYIPPPTR